MNRSRFIQIGCLLLAVILLVCSGLLLGPILKKSEKADLLTDDNLASMRRNPEIAMLMTMPGGLRVLFVNYLWIRSQDAHQEGRHYDAYQLAELICKLQPYHPGVWAFQAWNMAWNISVTTFTPDQRWQWVYNGVKLLRDQGISYNPRSLELYKELAWIFSSKIAGMLDDEHNAYKARWAMIMQNLLGAPPVDLNSASSLEEDTQKVIDAFAAIAAAPLDRDKARQGKEMIQADKLATVLTDPQCQTYAERLKKIGIEIGQPLLDAYNSYSLDFAVQSIKIVTPKLADSRAKEISAIINDVTAKTSREKLLSFVRAQLLWNEFRMDPEYMLKLMKRYDAPLDWRNAMSHGLYWSDYGMDLCQPGKIAGMVALNNARNVLNSLKALTWTGNISLRYNPENPDYPVYMESADLRYVKATQNQYMQYINMRLNEKEDKTFDKNILQAGHVNYLVSAIRMLVADGRESAAQGYYEFLKDDYKKQGPQWEYTDVRQFVLSNFREEMESQLRHEVVMQILTYSLKQAYVYRGLIGGSRGQELYKKQMTFSKNIYDIYQTKAVVRMKLLPFEVVASNVLARLIVRPGLFGLSLDVDQRSNIFRSMSNEQELAQYTYLMTKPILMSLCKDAGVDFDTAFPMPAGTEELRQKLMRKMNDENPEKASKK
ncbi:MAG TPA: hypothetical protein PKK48_03095 [Phycisphaerae bacterium]|mgnify:CR=1 FL=1|nr:hypothetical protein [Phycisphaerae bacterium]HPS52609.1 hypothetical protein [Phycisphaerae bacterium]